MFFDPVYMVVMIVGVILVAIPQWLVKSTFEKYSKVRASRGMTGAQVAKSVLQDAGIYNVSVEPIEGSLTDHYDPSRKVIRLSEDIYSSNSVAALGVAAHEAGHAIQDFKGYIPMKLRSGVVPAANLGSQLGPALVMGSLFLKLFLHISGLTLLIGGIGVCLYAAAVIFHLVTLPVELNASHRAMKALAGGGYLVQNEIGQTRKVLLAAALTYVAATLNAIIQLLYWAWLVFGRQNSRD